MAYYANNRSPSAAANSFNSNDASYLSGYHHQQQGTNGGGEDSSLSSGSSSFDTSTTVLNQEVRRRSHRPRGCRGGRKNRKKNQQQGMLDITYSGMTDRTVSPGAADHFESRDLSLDPSVVVMANKSDSSQNDAQNSSGSYNTFLSFATVQGCNYSRHFGDGSPITAFSNDILPPLPKPVCSEAPFAQGPNPYALTNQDAQQQIHNHYPDKQSVPLNSGGGASLFAISPRTFLLRGQGVAAW
jgi:hypothetical protein